MGFFSKLFGCKSNKCAPKQSLTQAEPVFTPADKLWQGVIGKTLKVEDTVTQATENFVVLKALKVDGSIHALMKSEGGEEVIFSSGISDPTHVVLQVDGVLVPEFEYLDLINETKMSKEYPQHYPHFDKIVKSLSS